MYKILTLNNISVAGLDRLSRDHYEVASEIGHPDAILLRSYNMHEMDIPETVKAVGRAGAGVNNIPVDALSKRGVPVFNAPGANANAVKELTLAGMFLAYRNLCQAWDFARGVEGDDSEINKQVEAGKKNFAGFELPGRTLGVIGLGAIGVKVANAAMEMGMNVIGYDPAITVRSAWLLSSQVQQATSIDDLLSRSDIVTVHVPLIEATHHMINAERIKTMKKGAVLLNFSRDDVVDEDAVVEAVEGKSLLSYVCDFPSNRLKNHDRIIALPHLGASTKEAEDNSAIMVVDQVKDYLEDGNITNSVNFPEVTMPRTEGFRISIVNSNVPNMVGQISTALAKENLNIVDLINKSKGDVAYTLADVEPAPSEAMIEEIASIKGVLSVRLVDQE